MNKEIFVEIPLRGCVEQAPENLTVRMQCADIERGGVGFVFDLLENGAPVLSAGLREIEGLFIELYLLKITGRAPCFQVDQLVAGAWQTKMATRLYASDGGTDGTGEIWVDDGEIWVGFSYAGQLIARAKLDEAQLAGLARMADAMATEFRADK